MQVTIKTLTNTTFKIEITPTDTVNKDSFLFKNKSVINFE